MNEADAIEKEISLKADEMFERLYIWECGCGERYTSEGLARSCRKCRVYLTEVDFLNRSVRNILLDGPKES